MHTKIKNECAIDDFKGKSESGRFEIVIESDFTNDRNHMYKLVK